MLSNALKARSLVLVAVSGATTLAHGGVVHVGPAGTWTSLQGAVDGSTDDDVLLVESGTYASASIHGKRLSIVADSGATVTLTGGISMFDVPAGATILLSGLNAHGLLVQHVDAPFRVEGCTFDGATGFASAAISLDQVTDASLVGCTAQATASATPSGHPALYAKSSTVAVASCTLTGGNGAPAMPTAFGATSGGDGGNGLWADASTVFVLDCVLTGGPGGDGYSGNCASGAPTHGGAGGAGGGATGGGHVRSLGGSSTGGAGGFGGFGFPCGVSAPDGAAGVAHDGSPADYELLSGVARTLTASRVVREGQSLALHAEGLPGDVCYLATTLVPGHSYSPLQHGDRLFGSPARRLRLGTIGASGTLDVNLPIGELGPGVASVARFLQGLCIDSGGMQWLSTAPVVQLLDAGV